MTYAVKEAYYTLQGEGAQTGRAAVFLRFAGCNLWSGLERDRAARRLPVLRYRFCRHRWTGRRQIQNGRGAGRTCARAVGWQTATGTPYVVCTGGEPLLQIDAPLIAALHAAGLEIGVETNGTLPAPAGLDWICVSPKASAALAQRSGDELKLVFPQDETEADPARFAGLQFQHFFLQPRDEPHDKDAAARHVRAAIAYCLRHPEWKLSLQTHKLTGMP